MYILGLSCYYHDSAAALLKDGRIIAACAEERLSGQKHDSGFPEKAVRFCLDQAGIDAADIDHVIFYDRPILKFDRLVSSLLKNAPFNYIQYINALPVWLGQKLWVGPKIQSVLGPTRNLWFAEHHLSHAAGAFYLSPFDRAAILTIDGVGEKTTASIGRGRGNRLELLWEMHYPHSVGLLYSAFTYFLGFRVNSGEYKVMGLAPYGKPRFGDLIRQTLVRIQDDGSIELDLRMFNFERGLTMTGRAFERLFRVKRRQPQDTIEPIHADIAASVQEVVEEIIFKMARFACRQTGETNLVLSGGVALNCRAAGFLRRSELFSDVFIQPAAGDDGGALGAALFLYHHILDQPRIDHNNIIALGPAISVDEIKTLCEKYHLPFLSVENDDEAVDRIAGVLASGRIVGIVRGRAEFGPRALGNRSILANPSDPGMKARINAAVKFRESFRPFAPVVLEEKAAAYFDLKGNSPYMTFLFDIRERMRSTIPAVTHVDGTARIQTVSPLFHPRLHRLLTEFESRTGLPVLLNTSFNLRGHPIAATALQVLQAFFSSGIDLLWVENIILDKSTIPPPYPPDLVVAPQID